MTRPVSPLSNPATIDADPLHGELDPLSKRPEPDPSLRPVVVLDTSVLVADPDCIRAFPGRDVVVPLTVIDELDGLKSRSDEVGWLARAALRTIEAQRVAAGGCLADGFELPGGGVLRVEINGIQKHLLREHGLDAEQHDNRIIGAALGQATTRRVTVVSNDAAFRIKAAHLGLDAVEHVPAEADDVGPGWSTLEAMHERIDCLYAAGSLAVDAVDGADTLPENSFAVLRAGSQSALVRRQADDLTLLPATPREAWGLRPRSKEQRFALDLLLDPDIAIVALDGPAGTGKSLLAIAAGLEQVVETGAYQRLSVFRPLVPVGREDIGFLPGDLATKTQPYFSAIFDAVAALTERRSMRDAERVIEQLLQAGQLTMEPITFLRGRSLANTFIVVDEATNLERAILKTLLTRVSEGTKIVLTGDVSQIDNPFASMSNNALTALVSAFSGQACFGHVRLTACERSNVASLAASLL